MTPDINLTHLRYFYDAVHLKSISRAARENFVSQSAISQGIVKLEQALKVALTTHQRQNFRLTEEGELVFEESKRIFATVEALKERLRAQKDELSGPVFFGCTNAIAQYFLPKPYLTMRNKHPAVSLKFHRGSLNFLHDALRQEKVSFVIAIDGPEFYEYQKEVLYKGHFRLYKEQSAKKGAGILVDHATNREVMTLKTQYRDHYGKELPIQEELSGWAMVKTFVEMGMGEGFLPDFMLNNTSTVQEVKLKVPLIPYTICAFWLKATIPTRATRAFFSEIASK